MLKKLNKIRKEVIPSLIPAVLPSLSTFAVINASVFSGYIAAQNATIRYPKNKREHKLPF